eukprot:73477-Hanusia_phi.AAC.1
MTTSPTVSGRYCPAKSFVEAGQPCPAGLTSTFPHAHAYRKLRLRILLPWRVARQAAMQRS